MHEYTLDIHMKKKKSAPSRGHAMNTQLQNLKYRRCLVLLTVKDITFSNIIILEW